MAEFEVKVERVLDVQEHPNADRLTIVKIRGYNCIANKHEDGSWRYQPGDHVVYIPEQAVLPEYLLRRLNMWNEDKGKGFLAGKQGNRVKAIKLRGVFSQGVLHPVELVKSEYNGERLFLDAKPDPRTGNRVRVTVQPGDDVADLMGIEKYEPEIPASMSGDVWNASGKTLKYDIENFQKYPNVIQPGEKVVITEKLHGTWACIGSYEGEWVITSKGLSGKGLAFKTEGENLEKNLYVRTLMSDKFKMLRERIIDADPIYVLGEIYGKGVQDLVYDAETPGFRVFDIYVGQPGQGRYLNWNEAEKFCTTAEVETVPVLHKGPFDQAEAENLRDGKTELGGENIREGIVITPQEERRDDELGRVKLKMVSPDYLTRKDGTEYN